MYRRAERGDLRNILAFLVGCFHYDYRDVFPPVDLDKMALHVARHIDDGVIFLAEKDGKYAGIISGMPAQYWFSQEWYFLEGFFYVHPDHRKSRIALSLLRLLKKEAHFLGMKLVCSVSTGEDIARKDKFFERNGFRRVGGIYCLEIPSWVTFSAGTTQT